MRTIALFLTGLLLFGGASRHANGQIINRFDWVQTLPAEPLAQTSDPDRNYYVLTKGNILIRFGTDGRERWRQTYANWPEINKIAVDAGGNLLIAGVFRGSLSIGDSTFVPPAEQRNFFLASLDAGGTVRWVSRVNPALNARSVADIRVDAGGRIYLLGTTATATLLLTMSPSGQLLRQQVAEIQGSTAPQPQALQVGSDASAYVLYNVFGRQFNETFLQKTDSVRTDWQLTISPLLGAGYTASGISLGLDRQTNAYALGSYSLLDRTSGQLLDQGQLLVKADSDGQPVWVKRGPFVRDSARATGLLADPSGTVLVRGQFDGTLIPNTFPAQYQPNDYMTLAQYSTAGVLRWKSRFDAPTGNDRLLQTERDRYGALLLTGSTTGSLPLGTLTATGTPDAPTYFLAKLQPAQLRPDSSIRAVCAGGSVALPGRYTGYFDSELTVLLSDSVGNFSRSTVIGRIPVATPGSYFAGPVVPPTVTLPTTITAGKNYRIRVVSSAPEYVGESIPVSVSAGPARPVVTQTGPDLVSSAGQGNQWFTDRKEAIPGATNQRFQPSQTGQYYVVSSVGGCSSLPSDLFTYLVTALDPNQPATFTIYPNPATDRVVIDWSAVSAGATARLLLYDMSGHLLHDVPRTGDSTELRLTDLAPGTYLLSAQADGQPVASRRLMIR
jgi:Secretion system C-terminal sorting domain